MYLSQIRLDNVKCFDTGFTINLERNGKPILWTSILGDNATGKTTLLRSIAICLCDEPSGAALLKESEGGYIRRDKLEATINLTFKDESNSAETFNIATTITESSPVRGPSFERIRQNIKPSEKLFPWDSLFACAYGTGRAVAATGDVSGYSVMNAVYNLFNYSEGLQNPELAFRRLSQNRRSNLRSSLKKILNLGGRATIGLTDFGLVVSGTWGTKMPLRDLADGYRSTFFWITDLWGWAVSHNPKIITSADISGIVLIDELEQHLHPLWQRYVIKRLREEFPRIQFIVTTHSPLIALGTADIDDASMVTLKLGDENNVTGIEREASSYRGIRADQILTSIFGLPIARSGGIGDQILQFQELFARGKLSKKEQETFDFLKDNIIKELPVINENAEDLKIHKEVLDLLAKLENDHE